MKDYYASLIYSVYKAALQDAVRHELVNRINQNVAEGKGGKPRPPLPYLKNSIMIARRLGEEIWED